MTTGNQDAGFGDAGLEEVPVLAYQPVRKIAAKVYDPEQKKFLVDDYGQYRSQHPVDSWVALQLTLVEGSIPSSSLLGNPGLSITHQGADFVNLMTERLSRKLQPKVISREIEVRRIAVTPLGRQGVAIEVDYKNLVLTNTPVRTARNQ